MEKPKKIDNNDMWFWTPEWQKGEAEAQKDIDCGNVEVFDSVDTLIASLSGDCKESKK